MPQYLSSKRWQIIITQKFNKNRLKIKVSANQSARLDMPQLKCLAINADGEETQEYIIPNYADDYLSVAFYPRPVKPASRRHQAVANWMPLAWKSWNISG